MGPLTKIAVLIAVMFGLSGCDSLPRGAAVQSEVLEKADDVDADFAVYAVSRALLPTVSQWPTTGTRHLGWVGHSHGSREQLIRAGDTLDVLIWDSGENSLLTGLDQRVAPLTNIRVSANGTIFVPYVGKLRVEGRSPDGARQLIQRSLEAVVPSAQVQVSMKEGRANSIDLVGGVNRPGNIPMPDNNFSVLAAISAGGGVSNSLTNPQIRLVRGHKIYGTSIDRLYENPSLDTRLLGGDKVIVEEDDRYFLSLGAAGREALHPFTKDKVSAIDAVAIIGGVNDNRANPEGILILREYPSSAVRPGVRGPRQTRVVFTLDLTASDGLFSARNFFINSGDLVLATESPVTSARTILGLIGAGFGLVAAANNVSN